MIRVAINALEDIPAAYENFPQLAWASVASNPVTPAARDPVRDIPTIAFADMTLGRKLGEGASGDVFLVDWEGGQVRVAASTQGGAPGAVHSCVVRRLCILPVPCLARQGVAHAASRQQGRDVQVHMFDWSCHQPPQHARAGEVRPPCACSGLCGPTH